jgi:hypothetical protein
MNFSLLIQFGCPVRDFLWVACNGLKFFSVPLGTAYIIAPISEYSVHQIQY